MKCYCDFLYPYLRFKVVFFKWLWIFPLYDEAWSIHFIIFSLSSFYTFHILSFILPMLLLTILLHSLGTGKETEETNLLQQLSEACLVVDALEPSVREELVKNFCSRELTSYQQIFEGAGLSNVITFSLLWSWLWCICLELSVYSKLAELAKLDKTERRYAWIKRRLRSNEEIWKIFPSSWHVPYLLCIQFCKLTRLVATTHLSSHVKHFILSV